MLITGLLSLILFRCHYITSLEILFALGCKLILCRATYMVPSFLLILELECSTRLFICNVTLSLMVQIFKITECLMQERSTCTFFFISFLCIYYIFMGMNERISYQSHKFPETEKTTRQQCLGVRSFAAVKFSSTLRVIIFRNLMEFVGCISSFFNFFYIPLLYYVDSSLHPKYPCRILNTWTWVGHLDNL